MWEARTDYNYERGKQAAFFSVFLSLPQFLLD
jgi:hypothetical protein